tara:strand:+ start:475 stop:1893 length:1419 start_codon:yes stop_codon:yes gene_type:complete
MGIKSSTDNNFGAKKWFGCFLKDANTVDEAMAWSYDIKQLAVNSANNLNMPSSLPDIHVITNPYATSAALVSAVSGAFKYHTYYDDGSNSNTSAMTGGKVEKYGLYAEASAFASSVAATSYYHFPFVPSGDWIHYAKGKKNYGLAGSSTFERWTYGEEDSDISVLVPNFSATSGNPHMFATSAQAYPANGSMHGAHWVDNYPRFQASNSEDKKCICCFAWSIEGLGSVSVKSCRYPGRKSQFWLTINLSVTIDMAGRTGCDDECATARKGVDWPKDATGSSKATPHATGGATITTKKNHRNNAYKFKLHSVGESQVDLDHLDCERPKGNDNVYVRAHAFLGTDTSATPATPYTSPEYNPCKSKSGNKKCTLGFTWDALIGTGEYSDGAMNGHELKIACGMEEPYASWGNEKDTDTEIMTAIGSTNRSRMFVEGAVEAAVDGLFGAAGPGHDFGNSWKGLAVEMSEVDCSRQR